MCGSLHKISMKFVFIIRIIIFTYLNLVSKGFVTQKLQGSYDIIHEHKLGRLHITVIHVSEEMLWIGTSAGMIIPLRISQLPHSLSTNKLSSNSIQFECLSFGRVGSVRFFVSNTEQGKRFLASSGDGFEDFNQNEEYSGKDDALSHLIS